jgi:RNA polymerase sigma factor (sigma-70 family)
VGIRMAGPKGDAEAAGEPPADGLLLDRFIGRGDGDAFAALMKRHGPYVLGVCRRVTRHSQDAEDVFQACFLELVRKARSIRRRGSVAGWLQAVAVRLARKAQARRARLHQREVTGHMNEAAVSPEDISWREVRQILEEQLARLPEELRLPLILCLFEGQTQEEAAQYLEVNPRTLRDRLHRGRELLRSRLSRRGVALSVLGVLLSGGSTQAAVPATLTQTTLHGATALATKAPLVGVIPPSVLGLMGSSVFAGWAALPAVVLGLVLVGGGAYVAWHRPARPQAATAPADTQTANGLRKVYRSFRGKQFDAEFFQWSGPNPEKYVRREDEGLRIKLPPEKGPALPVGVKLRYPVRGDFDLEATLELIHVAKPERWTAGVTVYVFMDSAELDGFWVGKMNERSLGPVFHLGQRIKSRQERANKFIKIVPTWPETGLARLRMVRQGSRFSMFASEGAAGDYLHLETCDVSAADLQIVRFAADPVEVPNVAIDARLIDFSISAQEFVGYDPKPR